MKLNDEMVNLALSNEGICTNYNDDFVLLKKAMPVTDEQLDWYLSSLKDLKDSGVNIATVVDYRLLPSTTKTFENVGSYTQGVFLEERAKGKSLNSDSIYLKPSKDYDFNEVVCGYLKKVDSYLEELELRAQAPQEMYDKLIMDCHSIQNVGLTIDPKPLNFFFNEQLGYTIIDVIPNHSSKEDDKKYFPQYLLAVVFGYGRPRISIGYDDFSILSPDLMERLKKAGEVLEAKLVVALRKYGYSEENIVIAVGKNKFRYESKLAPVELEDMEEYFANHHLELQRQEQERKKNSSDDGGFIFSC